MSAPDFTAPLIPVTSTEVEHALSRAMKIAPEVWAAALRVGRIRADLPDAALPFLAWELGLDEVAAYVPDLRRVLADGAAWQRRRGTPAAIAQALGWIDAPLALIEEEPAGSWWDLFQLGLAAPMAPAEVAPVIALARLSKPAHADVIRIFGGFDERPIAVDQSGLIDAAGFVDDWSGIYVRPEWPKLSFGRADARATSAGLDAAASERRTKLMTAASPSISAALGGWPIGPFPAGPYPLAWPHAAAASLQQ